MSEKTEKPTQKRLEEASKKGQSFKSRDLTTACLTFFGIAYLLSADPLMALMDAYRQILAHGGSGDVRAYAGQVMAYGVELLIPILAVGAGASALPVLLQTGFRLATKALAPNFSAINPVQGFKRIFSLRTFKDFIKAFCYLAGFVLVAVVVWHKGRGLLFAQLNMTPAGMVAVWHSLVKLTAGAAFACVVVVAAIDAVAEFWLFMRDQKMAKHEVKREHKETQGNPELKSKRRQLHEELLSEQVRSDVRGSNLIVANPEHIAIGIYFRPQLCPLPFVSVMESNQMALAVRHYAESVGVPVVRDIELARKLYRTHRRYSFVRSREVERVLRLLEWLADVEAAGKSAAWETGDTVGDELAHGGTAGKSAGA
ncbi:Surface presentation of antigens protein SpaS [Pandoraea terrae]|uniref:Surface presentation of antigens protein SpaS n=1 Tax=Pandoraea terrae TaxID=1537710 RepID=A0A5E4TD29_9BURK|nr:EscU/YscU/HrcU family type III secretion system export apparatus switch protein [Pandoraea terrae]VVD84438.1 Surface presentation of antigens protein SpaS [Pandoraea terrae]